MTSWVAQFSVQRLFTLEIFGQSRSPSSKSVAILGIALLLQAGFESPIATTLFRLLISYTLAGIVRQAGCRILGEKFSISIKACTCFIIGVGYWSFEIFVLPKVREKVITQWSMHEVKVLVSLIGLTLLSMSVIWSFGDFFALLFHQDSGRMRERVVKVKDVVDEIVTVSREQRRLSQVVAVRPPASTTHIRQNFAIYLVEVLIKTIRGFNLSERNAADFRHRSDRWTEELKEDNVYLSSIGLSETQMFITFILQLNYQHRINNDAGMFGKGVQQEVLSWIKTVALQPQNQLYIEQARGLLRKYTTAATLSTLDRVFPPLPEGLEPVSNSNYIGCLALYVCYVMTKDVTEVRYVIKYILPVFLTYRFVLNRRGLCVEEDSNPLLSIVTPKNIPVLFKVLGFLIVLHGSHSKRMKNLLPKMLQNSLVFNFLRIGLIPGYFTLRRYINANWEVVQ